MTNLHPRLPRIVRAPEFAGISHWFNSKPLRFDEILGKPALIDFWAFSCVNCLRTLPYIKRWHKSYSPKGLKVIGVHTPEFEFEKLPENVEASIKRLKIVYPVAMDNNFETWNAFANRCWPALYLIDQEGYIIHQHFGEGDYEETEKIIRKLLQLKQMEQEEITFSPAHFGRIATPEIYWGLMRLQWLGNKEDPGLEAREFTMPPYLPPNFFGIEGWWRFAPEYAEQVSEKGLVRLNFFAGKVHMVAASGTFKPVTVMVRVDGKETARVEIEEPGFYTLFDSRNYAPHLLELSTEKDLIAYTFTFG